MRALLCSVVVIVLCGCAAPREAMLPIPAHAVIGVEDRHLSANHWVKRAPGADRVVLDADAIAAQNAALKARDPTFNDLESLPTRISASAIRERIAKLSTRPTADLYDERGEHIPAARLDSIAANLALDRVSDSAARFGMIVRRADLRTFPTRLRVFRSNDDADIDRFQESALFPGTPVVITHASEDGEWYFVISPLYAAWIEKQFVAEGTRDEVLGYGRKEPYLVVVGAKATTVFTRERPELSELQLEMGVRVPLVANWPADRLVNGQHPYTAFVVELPWRDRDGALRFAPALVPKTADATTSYLELTHANVVRQSFKFLGERYGWGHSYNARDCSGFVSEVYRSFGLQIPRNTRDQATSPVLERISFHAEDTNEERLNVIKQLQVGDLVYVPGHVMMVIGHESGVPFVIHDTTGITYKDDDGEIRRVGLNAVAVTPLTPLLAGDRPIVERIYSIVKLKR